MKIRQINYATDDSVLFYENIKNVIASHMTYVLNVDRHRFMWNHAYVLYEETNII